MRTIHIISGLIILLLGLAITGAFGSLLMALGILILLYAVFTRETPRETARYVEPDHHQDTPLSSERDEVKEYKEPKPKYRNVDRAERELRAWDSQNKVKPCPSCGSTSNPPNARFCADCGSKL